MDVRTVVLVLLIELILGATIALVERATFLMWQKDCDSDSVLTVYNSKRWIRLLPGIFTRKRIMYAYTLIRAQALMHRTLAKLEGDKYVTEKNKYLEGRPELAQFTLNVLNAILGMADNEVVFDTEVLNAASLLVFGERLYAIRYRNTAGAWDKHAARSAASGIKEEGSRIMKLDLTSSFESKARDFYSNAIRETYPRM